MRQPGMTMRTVPSTASYRHPVRASWITDATGTPVQHLQYLPYGEPYINQRAAGHSERFTFTGKERDEETGYSYFGARYMDHELMTMWLSVDPMADKYPNISPYVYCVWNPVRLVDPDRNDWYVPKGQSTPIVDKNVTSNNCPERATYIGKTAHWFGQTENDMQYYYHGAEDGALSKQDMTVTIFGDKDGYDSQYGILDGVRDYYGEASTAWRNAKNKDKSKSRCALKKNGMLGTAIGAGIRAITGGISGGMGGDAVGKKIYKWTK